jgi:hypothetical protein
MKIRFWSTVALGILGSWFLFMSFFLGYASSAYYERILSASLKYGLGSSGVFSICLAISESKYRWLFLIPIAIQFENHFQAIDRLVHMAGG